jgi:NAD(P)-dependent dehydrogenase (short-subunit alcohol dehydrogenase family)
MVSCSRYRGTARLDGKTAVVTGSNTGIGKFTVLDFVKRGELTYLFAAETEAKTNGTLQTSVILGAT